MYASISHPLPHSNMYGVCNVACSRLHRERRAHGLGYGGVPASLNTGLTVRSRRRWHMGATPDGVPRPRTGGVHRTSSLTIQSCGAVWGVAASRVPRPQRTRPPPAPSHIIDHCRLVLWILQGLSLSGYRVSPSLPLPLSLSLSLSHTHTHTHTHFSRLCVRGRVWKMYMYVCVCVCVCVHARACVW